MEIWRKTRKPLPAVSFPEAVQGQLSYQHLQDGEIGCAEEESWLEQEDNPALAWRMLLVLILSSQAGQ